MKHSFYTLGQMWAKNTRQTEVPTAEEVRDHIKSSLNLSPKRVGDADVADFLRGAAEAVKPVEEVFKERAKRTYKKKTTVKAVEDVAPEATDEETEEEAS